MRTGGKVPDLAQPVTNREGRGRSNGHPRPPLGKQDPNAGDRRRAEGGARVVVGEDLIVGRSLLGVPVRAPLREADAVAPTAPGDDEGR